MGTLRAAVSTAVQSALADSRIVGAVIGVARRGEIALLEAFGEADREAARPMTTDAIFFLASATKPIATAAIMALLDRQILDLDVPVTTYLPAFQPVYGDTRPTITLRQLLTHTSGLSYPFREPIDGPYHRAGVATGLDQPGLSGADQLARLGSVPLLFAPGSAWGYSLGVDVAGLAAAAAAARPLPDLVAEYITGPLGMTDTAFGISDANRLVTHYGVDTAGAPLRMLDGYAGPTAGSPAIFAPSRLTHPESYPSGGGGMAGTAFDLLRFIETLRLGGGPILSARSARAMTTSALPRHLADGLEPGWSYGLGTEVLLDPHRASGPERPGAFKGSGGYGHRWFVDPALELSVVAMTNCAPEGVRGRFTTDLRAAIYGAS